MVVRRRHARPRTPWSSATGRCGSRALRCLMWGTSVTSLCAAALGWRQSYDSRRRQQGSRDSAAHARAPGKREPKVHVHPYGCSFKKSCDSSSSRSSLSVSTPSPGWGFLLPTERVPAGRRSSPVRHFVYLAILSILIGALSSAEERHMGTLEWHLLLPMAQWKQWCIKAGTAFLLAIALGVGLPGLLSYIDSPHSTDPSSYQRSWSCLCS